MKLLIITTMALTLAACTSTDMALLSGNYDSAFRIFQGHGVISQNADGTKSFRFVIAEDAFDSIITSEASIEESRLRMLGQFLGKENQCNNGYKVTNRTTVQSNVIYEGDCL